jgi:hypothetical protein
MLSCYDIRENIVRTYQGKIKQLNTTQHGKHNTTKNNGIYYLKGNYAND